MLIEGLLPWNQLDSFFNSQFPSVDLGLHEKEKLSSLAKSMKTKAFDTLHKSLMYNKNNNEAKMDPRGTPHSKCLEKEFKPLHSTNWTLQGR